MKSPLDQIINLKLINIEFLIWWTNTLHYIISNDQYDIPSIVSFMETVIASFNVNIFE